MAAKKERLVDVKEIVVLIEYRCDLSDWNEDELLDDLRSMGSAEVKSIKAVTKAK